MAVIVSSHLLSEMEMMCDRIGIIQDGRLVDVQLVQEFVHGTDTAYEFEVVPSDKALDLLTAYYPKNKANRSRNGLTVEMGKEEIPHLVKLLAAEEISVFGIKEVAKTLEDRFLEVTSEKEAAARG